MKEKQLKQRTQNQDRGLRAAEHRITIEQTVCGCTHFVAETRAPRSLAQYFAVTLHGVVANRDQFAADFHTDDMPDDLAHEMTFTRTSGGGRRGGMTSTARTALETADLVGWFVPFACRLMESPNLVEAIAAGWVTRLPCPGCQR